MPFKDTSDGRTVVLTPGMVEAVRFRVLGRPQQRGSKTVIGKKGGGLVLSANGRPMLKDSNKNSGAWMDLVRAEAHNAWGRDLLSGPLALSAVFHFARPRAHFGTGRNADRMKPTAPPFHSQSPDLAKLIRCLEDALTGVVWRDDKQVVRYVEPTERRWTTGAEGAEVVVYVLAEATP